ncbi:MAG: OmpA family protein [Bacteroidota bacterium]
MKVLGTISCCLFLCCSLFAQAPIHQGRTDNIVPNPGFERYSSSPIGWFYKGSHFTNVMKYWHSATSASPDVFGPKVRVPTHWAAKGFGEQAAHDGVSMVGITAFGCEDGKPHCREYIQIQLKEPLVLGQSYYAEFWVAPLARGLRINNLAMYFSKERIGLSTAAPIEVIPQVFSESIVQRYGQTWHRIAGRFQAESEAEYLTIGNFCPDSLTQMFSPDPNNLNYAYYYIDDVLVKKEEPILKVPIKADDLSRIKIEEGKVVQLKNIFFDSDKSELLPRSYVELNKLLQLLQENPTMIIEISGHTDSTGDFDYNLFLSRRRAKAVVDFLIQRGISPSRSLYKGYGSTKAISSNDTERGRQLNRRVEFLIVHK